MSDTSLRARGPSEIVDAAFALYRRHAGPYLMVTAIAMTPVLILNLLFSSLPPAEPTLELMVQYYKGILPGLVTGLASYVLVGAFVAQMGSEVYLGRQPDVSATLRSVMPLVPKLLVLMIVTAMMFGIS